MFANLLVHKKHPFVLFLKKHSTINFFFLLLLTVVFFALPMLAASDASFYVQNAHVLAGELPFSNWYTVRGPVFSLLLRISFALFGESSYGTSITFYFLYLILVFSTLYLCTLLGIRQKIGHFFTWLLCTVLVFLNPSILTYSHFLLTEFPALVLAILAFCLIVKTQQLLLSQKSSHIILTFFARYCGIILITVSLFALKQMFFPLAIIPFIISEIFITTHKFSLKQLLISMLAILLSVSSVFIYSAIWENFIAKRAALNETYTANSMASSTLIDGLRYFRLQERGLMNKPILIEVTKGPGLEVIDSFTFTFDGSFGNSLQFIGTCFSRSPKQFFTSYTHNYLIISNVRRPVNYTEFRAHTAVSTTNKFNLSFETYAWLEHFKGLNKGTNPYTEELIENLEPFQQNVDSGLISNLLFNTGYPGFSFFLYSFPAFIAPFVFFASIVFMVLRRKIASKFAFWQHITLLSGTVFGNILFLSLTASNIDRYGFPTSLHSIFLLCLLAFAFIRFLRRIISVLYEKTNNKKGATSV